MNSTAPEPHRYALIGHPIAHSWSPFIHGLFAQQTGGNLSYKLLDVPPEKFRFAVVEFFAAGGRGLNVTVPHKQAAAELVNRLTPRAERARAVNTIQLEDTHELLGDNTDGAGLVTDLTKNLCIDLADMHCLILGAGGATRGVLAPLAELEPASIVIANRTPERAAEIAGEFSDLGNISGCGFDDIPRRAFGLIINATSASLQGDVPPVPDSAVDAKTVCYDMTYGKGDTSFIRWARKQGAGRPVKGWGMLVEQAAESFKLWHGVRPDTKPVLDALTIL
jgi:shikimate dehydrogenase